MIMQKVRRPQDIMETKVYTFKSVNKLFEDFYNDIRG